MSTTAIIRYSGQRVELYSASLTARLAGIPLSFVYRCEDEGLIQGYELSNGDRGYLGKDIVVLARVYRLYRDLELDLHAIAIILDLQDQVERLHQEMNSMRREMGR